MHLSRVYQKMFWLFCCLLILLFAVYTVHDLLQANSNNSTTLRVSTTATTQGSIARSSLPTPSTTCPPVGSARMPIVSPLTQTHNPTIFYFTNDGTAAVPASGQVERYDVVHKTISVILTIPEAFIDAGQISADGQWVLFNMHTTDHAEIRLVRIDGQQVQTLLCAPQSTYINNVQWSHDQKSLAFSEMLQQDNLPTTYLLNMTNGLLNKELAPSSGTGYIPRRWLDNTHLYLTTVHPYDTSSGLYILNTQQHNASPQEVLTLPYSAYCWDFASTDDGKSLFSSQCSGGGGTYEAPDTITTLTTTGAMPQVIPFDNTLAVKQIRQVGYSSTQLLLTTENTDTAHNGLWIMDRDGANLQNLTTDNSGEQSNLNLFTQDAWSNVSRDGTMYALQITNMRLNNSDLFFGVLSGGTPRLFAYTLNSTSLNIIGWTTL